MAGSDVDMEPSANGPELAYNPDQDPDEKRRVRGNYRQLQAQLEAKQANPNELTAEELTESVKHANSLFRSVKAPQEATLDSQVLLKASTLGAQKARAMRSAAGAFDMDDFVAKLITFMGGRNPLEDRVLDDSDDSDAEVDEIEYPLDWEKIGRRALAKSRRVPTMDFMLGPLSIEQKKRAQAKRSRLEKDKENEQKPQELQDEDISRSENETSKNVKMLQLILENHGKPVNLFEFAINPNDFAQSVENIFYLSFLIRDGVVALEVDQDTEEPIIFFCSAPTDEDYDKGLSKRQLVFEFDKATWRRAIEVFNITKSMIPQRPPPAR